MEICIFGYRWMVDGWRDLCLDINGWLGGWRDVCLDINGWWVGGDMCGWI